MVSWAVAVAVRRDGSPSMKDYTSTSSLRKTVSPEVPGSRWTVRLASKDTGQLVEIDSQLMRVARMQNKVSAWASYTRHLGLDHSCEMKMVTLTYAPTPDCVSAWRPHHIGDYLGKLRKWLKDELKAYAWVSELQDRGEVHYHLLLYVRRGVAFPYPDLSGMWPHGMSRVDIARSTGYVVKYSQKGTDDQVYPAGLHLFAVWIRKDLRDALYDRFIRVKSLPSWLHDQAFVSDEWPKRAEGGGWLLKLAGLAVFVASPYAFVGLQKVIMRT